MNHCDTTPPGDVMAGLLREVLTEMRGMRRALERTQSPALELESCFLSLTSDLMGSREWTCQELMEELELSSSMDGARLQGVLRELQISTTRDLGNFLRGKAGICNGGQALRRHRANRSGVMRWSILTT